MPHLNCLVSLMANPQTEDGYTKIANSILDALVLSKLSGQDFKISLLIIRKTYGFSKKEDSVSLSQMMQATGMGKIRCSQVVTRLQLMKILTVTENINGVGKKYKFNKDFEEWDTVNKNINRYQKVKQTVNKKRNPPLMKTLTTKETLTKEKIQKKGKQSKTTLPDGFSISDGVRKWASEKGIVRLEEHFESFIIACEAKGYEYANWDAALKNAIRKNWAEIGGRNGQGIRTSRSDPRDKNLQSREDAEIAAITARREAAKEAARNKAAGATTNDDAPDF